jgi:outer membrane protein assembly factor BamB
MHVRFLFGIACGLLIASTATAQEWPRFRGHNGSGVSASILPTRWTDKDYRWQVKLPGPGHSSPILWGERVFVTSSDGAGKLHVLSLDAVSGRTIWSQEFPAGPPRGHKDNNLASATPAVDDQRIYLAWGTPKEVVLLALTHEGKPVWRRDLGPYGAGHGFGCSPIVHEGLVILTCEQDGKDSLAAVDAATGKDRWRVARKSRNTYATPCLLRPPGRAAELIAVSYEDGITSLDPATGRRNWEVDAFDKRHDEAAIASPIVHDDLVLGSAGWLSVRYETIAVRPGWRAEPRHRPGGKRKVETVYKLDRDPPLVPTPVVKDDLLFLWNDRGIVSCCSAATGQKHWRERVEGSFYASPVIAGQHVYCPSREGDMIVLAASRKFEQVARIPLGEGTHATPALAGGRMVVRTLTRVMCLEGNAKRE